VVAEQYFSPRVIVKVHLVKMGAYGKDAQRHHLDYIQRDSAAREGEKALLYSRDEIMLDGEEFHERGIDDRHQFRVIVSPEDGKELGDLRTYTRNVMAQMERDLGTKLDWVAAKPPQLIKASYQTTNLNVDDADVRFDYLIKGDNPDWRPTRVFDDGRKVFIQFPKALAVSEAPPLFLTDESGKQGQLVNYRVNGDYYVVDRLFAAAELRLGEKKQVVVRIERMS
jgi:hypothetical protein